jgi:hypothetical protein
MEFANTAAETDTTQCRVLPVWTASLARAPANADQHRKDSMTSLSTDELSTLETFILKHDLPDFQVCQVRNLHALVDAINARNLGVLARTRIEKQVANLASVAHLVTSAINDAKG